MNDQTRGSASTLRTIALIAIPVIVAIAVAAFVLSARDKDSSEAVAPTTTSATTSTTDDQPGTTTTVDPGVASFCTETATISTQMQEASKRFEAKGDDVPSPGEVADLLESFDLSAIDVDRAPAALQDDLRYLIERRDAAVAEIRTAPEGTAVSDLVPADLLERFASIIQFYLDNCG